MGTAEDGICSSMMLSPTRLERVEGPLRIKESKSGTKIDVVLDPEVAGVGSESAILHAAASTSPARNCRVLSELSMLKVIVSAIELPGRSAGPSFRSAGASVRYTCSRRAFASGRRLA